MSDNEQKIPLRSEVAADDKWDLSKLFTNDEDWNKALAEFEKAAEKLPHFKGTLGKSADALAGYLDFSRGLNILGERLIYYAELRQSEDEGDSSARAMMGKITMAAAKANAASSWENPELLAIPEKDMETFLKSERVTDYRIYLQRTLRFKPYILSDKEEKIIALHAEGEGTVHDAFSVLTNVDFNFGYLDTPEGRRPLSQSTFSVFMESPDRALRENAYKTFYGCFEAHKTTLASLYSGSVKKDVINARVRGYSSARAASLFRDNVSESVYDNLIATVSGKLDSLHRYYSLRKRALKLQKLKHFDVYAPLVQSAKKTTSWLRHIPE